MTATVNEAIKCPSCGKRMPAGALAGLCPACLLAQGAETEPATRKGPGHFEPPPIAEIAKLFPRLEVLSLLGAGGMGAVYKARQPALDRMVALKILPATGPAGPGHAERFNREARALARLSHANIVAVFEFGQVEGLHFFIMEFVDGANLRQLEKAGRLSPREALQIIPQICDALQYAHDEGVVHRDIKPENVLVDRKGRVKIADFGLAKLIGVDAGALRLTVEGQVMGTPHYMAPEQVERPLTVDHRADIYSLGVVLYEMLTGDLPLGKFAPPSRKVRVDVRLDEIVLRALENDPERRYQQVSEVKQGVATVAGSPESEAVAPGHTSATAPAGKSGERFVRWLGIPVAVARNGRRELNLPGAFAATFVTMMCAGITHLMVTWMAGREHALTAWVVLAGLVIVALGIHQAMNRQDFECSAGRRFTLDALSLVGLVAFIIGSHYGLVRWIEERRTALGEIPAQVAKVEPETGTLVATLADGTTIELLAVSGQAPQPDGWWAADGRSQSHTTFTAEKLGQVTDANATTNFDFIFRLTEQSAGAEGVYIEFEHSEVNASGGEVLMGGQILDGAWPIRAAFPESAAATTARVGMGLDAWQTIAHHAPALQSSSQMKQAGKPNWDIAFQHATDGDGNAQVAVQFGPWDKRWQVRVVALDTAGIIHTKADWTGSALEKKYTRTFTYRELPLSAVKEFQMQIRPVHVVEFRDIALRRRDQQGKSFGQIAVVSNRNGALEARLPGGGSVELLALSDPDSGPDGWWQPDGTPLRNVALVVGMPGNVQMPDAQVKDLILGLMDLPEHDSNPQVEFESSTGYSGGGEVLRDGKPLPGARPYRVAFTKSARTAVVRVGIGGEPWRTIATRGAADQHTTSATAAGDPKWTVSFTGQPSEIDGQAQVTYVFGPLNRHWTHRVVAVDLNGVEHGSSRGNSTSLERMEFFAATFAELRLKTVKEFRLQVRPVHWIEFRDVRLVPRDVPAAVAGIHSGHPADGPKASSFGPVREVAFNELIDFDTGRTGEYPKSNDDAGLFEGVGRNLAWMQQNGFDAAAGVDDIQTLGVTVVDLTRSDWETLVPDELNQRLQAKGRFPSELKPAADGEPVATFGFRTREGGTGVLQLVRLGDPNIGATVRFKLATPLARE